MCLGHRLTNESEFFSARVGVVYMRLSYVTMTIPCVAVAVAVAVIIVAVARTASMVWGSPIFLLVLIKNFLDRSWLKMSI